MDDAAQPVEGRKARRGLVLEVAEDVVLDDRQGELVGELQEPVGHDGRERGAGRIVDRGVGDVEPRPVLGEGLAERCDVRTRGGVGGADDSRAVRPQEGVEVEIAGVVDQHRVAGLEQEPADEVDRLRAGFREDDLIGRSFDAALGQAPGYELAERRQAERGTVVAQVAAAGTRERAKRPPQAVLREPGRRKPSAARPQAAVAGFQRLPRHPQGIDRPVELRAGRREGERRRLIGNIETGTRPGQDRAFGDQPLVGLDHRRGRHLQRPGQPPDRGQLRPRRQAAAGDALPDRRHDHPRSGRSHGLSAHPYWSLYRNSLAKPYRTVAGGASAGDG